MEIQKIADQTVCDSENAVSDLTDSESPPVLVGENSFVKIRMLAENNPDMVFISLAHRINPGLLRDSFRLVRRSEAAGVDGVTAGETLTETSIIFGSGCGEVSTLQRR